MTRKQKALAMTGGEKKALAITTRNPMTGSGTVGLPDRDVLPVLVEGLAGHDLITARGYVLEEVHTPNLIGSRDGGSEVRIPPVDRTLQAV